MMFFKPAADKNENDTTDNAAVDCVDEGTQTDAQAKADGDDDIWPAGLKEKCKNRPTPDNYDIAWGFAARRSGHRHRNKRFDLPMMTGGVDRSDESEDTDDLHIECQFYEFMSRQRDQFDLGKRKKHHRRG